MRRFPWAVGVIALAAPLVLPAAAAAPQQEKAVVARFVVAAAGYVRRYQTELSSVIADEHYVQHVRVQTPRNGDTPLETTIQSEVFFMFTEGHDWMTIRDVRLVDGVAPSSRPDLRAALIELPAAQVAARFKAYNSRFNVGRVHRNFNEPTLSLLVLDDRHRGRFTFTRAKPRDGDNPAHVRLAFRESQRPTLIRDLNGRPAYSQGDFSLDPATGRINDIRFTLTIGRLKVALETGYARNEALGIHVPVRFIERYEDGTPPRGARARDRHEEIECEATYTNFRRFTVQTRIR